MRVFWQIFLFVIALCFRCGGAFIYAYPDESLAYYHKIKRRITHYFYPQKNAKRYQTFKAKLPVEYDLHGIDVSAYQGLVDWEIVRSMKIKNDSVTFAFIKATEGTGYFDRYFHHNWEGSKKAGLLRGAYHYFRPNRAGKEQAYYFIQRVQIEKGDLPPVLDIEEIKDISAEELQKELKVFLQILEEHYQVLPVIYTSRVFYQQYLGKAFNRYPLWVAQYKNLQTPQIKGRNWHFWQHSYEGTVSGINVPVDLNVFVGTLKQLKNLCKK
jgi:lysozyme